jgi:hypothetical protein
VDTLMYSISMQRHAAASSTCFRALPYPNGRLRSRPNEIAICTACAPGRSVSRVVPPIAPSSRTISPAPINAGAEQAQAGCSVARSSVTDCISLIPLNSRQLLLFRTPCPILATIPRWSRLICEIRIRVGCGCEIISLRTRHLGKMLRQFPLLHRYLDACILLLVSCGIYC